MRGRVTREFVGVSVRVWTTSMKNEEESEDDNERELDAS